MRIILANLVIVCTFSALNCGGHGAEPVAPAPQAIAQETVATSNVTSVTEMPSLDAAMPLLRIQSKFVWPAGGTMSTYFGAGHPNGIDIALRYGEDSPIRASAEGTVVFAGEDCCVYGRHIVIEHLTQMKTLYAHLERPDVEVGQHVQQGQVIGLGGDTGDSTGKHLHFGLFEDDVPVDPLRYLPGTVVRTSAPCINPVAIGPDSVATLTIDAPYFFAVGGAVVGDGERVAGALTKVSGQEYRLEIPPVAKADGREKYISLDLVTSNGQAFRSIRCDLLVSTHRTFPNPIAPRSLHSAAPLNKPQGPMPTATATPQLRLIPPSPTPPRLPSTPAPPTKPKATPGPALTFPLKP
jgi:hypothetical protein